MLKLTLVEIILCVGIVYSADYVSSATLATTEASPLTPHGLIQSLAQLAYTYVPRLAALAAFVLVLQASVITMLMPLFLGIVASNEDRARKKHCHPNSSYSVGTLGRVVDRNWRVVDLPLVVVASVDDTVESAEPAPCDR